jgi:hypothetical protein
MALAERHSAAWAMVLYHRPRSGLPEEVDARVEATQRLHGRSVSRAVVSDVCDLRVEFTGGVSLEN